VSTADVYKSGVLAARLERVDGSVQFSYLDSYRATGGPAVATTLPLDTPPVVTPAGAVPPFFAGLLPEGRRLSSLQRALKASADDELTLLLAVGADPVGDVQIVPAGAAPSEAAAVEVRRDFGAIRFSELLTDSGIVDPAGIAGAQEKVSARMLSLPVRRAHERYILKLNPPEYPHLVENEHAFVELAHRPARMRTAASRIVHDADGRSGLLVTRFDRAEGGETEPRRLAVEDACQLLDRWPADKYNLTMEDAARAVIEACTAPAIAARDVFRQVVFAWLTGNGDLHAKNLSVLTLPDGQRIVAPAYDLPSTVLYGDLSFALALQGRTTGISRRHLRTFADEIGLPASAAETVLDRMLAATRDVDDVLGRIGFDQHRHDATRRELAARRRLVEG
jgi:serine/threonine-protein kinase HipA